jgi:hypothetical protein
MPDPSLTHSPLVESELTQEQILEHVSWFADQICMENNRGDIVESCRELIAAANARD